MAVDNAPKRTSGAPQGPGVALWPAVLGLALAMTFVGVLERPLHSLSYASFALLGVAALGWALEARALSQPARHEEAPEEEEGPGLSFWPVVLALSVAGMAAGTVFGSGYAGLLVALPLGVGAAAAWIASVRAEASATRRLRVERSAAVAGPLVQPLPPRTLDAAAIAGAAIGVESIASDRVSRRGLLRVTFWAGLGASVAALGALILDMLYPRGVQGFGSIVTAGVVSKFPRGSKTQNYEGHFWLANLTPEQGGDGFLALWWKCPHLGCTVPWRADFPFVDPATGQVRIGWFRCPCHGSTYSDAGVRVFGPAPHSMDRMALTIDAAGTIKVDTGKVAKGTVDNAKFAVPPPAG